MIDSITKHILDILEKFFKDVQKTIYCRGNLKHQIKMLYAARYWAEYFMKINNYNLLQQLKKQK